MLLTKRYELLNDVTMKLFDQTKSINKYNGDFDVKKIEKYYQKDIKEYVSIMNEILNKSNKIEKYLDLYYIIEHIIL